MIFSGILLLVLFLATGQGLYAEKELNRGVLIRSKWFNDEFNFHCHENRTFLSFYTLGKDTGVLRGSYLIDGNSLLLQQESLPDGYNGIILSDGKLTLLFKEDSSNSKSSFMLEKEGGDLQLWNEEKSYGSVIEGTNIRILAKTSKKFQVNKWYSNWYYIEHEEPAGNQLAYRTVWMFGEFINWKYHQLPIA